MPETDFTARDISWVEQRLRMDTVADRETLTRWYREVPEHQSGDVLHQILKRNRPQFPGVVVSALAFPLGGLTLGLYLASEQGLAALMLLLCLVVLPLASYAESRVEHDRFTIRQNLLRLIARLEIEEMILNLADYWRLLPPALAQERETNRQIEEGLTRMLTRSLEQESAASGITSQKLLRLYLQSTVASGKMGDLTDSQTDLLQAAVRCLARKDSEEDADLLRRVEQIESPLPNRALLSEAARMALLPPVVVSYETGPLSETAPEAQVQTVSSRIGP